MDGANIKGSSEKNIWEISTFYNFSLSLNVLEIKAHKHRNGQLQRTLFVPCPCCICLERGLTIASAEVRQPGRARTAVPRHPESLTPEDPQRLRQPALPACLQPLVMWGKRHIFDQATEKTDCLTVPPSLGMKFALYTGCSPWSQQSASVAYYARTVWICTFPPPKESAQHCCLPNVEVIEWDVFNIYQVHHKTLTVIL